MCCNTVLCLFLEFYSCLFDAETLFVVLDVGIESFHFFLCRGYFDSGVSGKYLYVEEVCQ